MTFSPTHEQNWSQVQSLQLGPPVLGAAWRYLLVVRHGAPWLRIDINLDAEEFQAFEECLYHEGALWLGLGCRVARVDLDNLEFREIKLGQYFGSFFPLGESLLICSATSLYRLGARGDVLWVTRDLGIDGVVVNRVKGEVIYGEGEWNPPGGWREFQLTVHQGHLLNSH